MRKPNFFVVGAPKCGTTALYQYLAQHPDVFLPETKEVHYFGSDLYLPGETRSEQEYLKHFSAAGNAKRIGHSFGWYLFSPRAAAEIKTFNPAAKIIIMVRDPVDMIYSLHAQRLYAGTEDIENFQQAIEAEDGRRSGTLPAKHSWITRGLFYLDVAKFTKQIERYVDAFSWNQIKVIVFDDFKNETARVFQETCEFLELDANFEPALEIVNPHKRARSRKFQEALDSRPSPSLQRVGRRIMSQATRRSLYQTLRRWNTDRSPRPRLDPQFRRQLQAEFRDDVERLSNLLGRDLTHWSRS